MFVVNLAFPTGCIRKRTETEYDNLKKKYTEAAVQFEELIAEN